MTMEELQEVPQSIAHIVVEIIEYIPNSILSRTIIKKSSGNVKIMSLDSGEGLTEKISPFTSYAQIIDGKAEIIIDGQANNLNTGQGIIIPAHRSHIINANERFKMMLTIIKDSYE